MVFSYQRLKKFFSLDIYALKDSTEKSCDEEKFCEDQNKKEDSAKIKKNSFSLSFLPIMYFLVQITSLAVSIIIKISTGVKYKSDLVLENGKFVEAASFENKNGSVLESITQNANNLTSQIISQAYDLTGQGIISNNEISSSSFVSSLEPSSTNLFSNFVSNYYQGYYSSIFEILGGNQKITFISSAITFIIGLIIVMILFSILKQRFNVPEYKKYMINIYIMLILGLISNFLNLLVGCQPYLVSYQGKIQNVNVKYLEADFPAGFSESIEEDFLDLDPTIDDFTKNFGSLTPETLFNEIDFENIISMKVLIFMSYVFLSLLYSLYVLSNVALLKKTINESFNENKEMKNDSYSECKNWINRKFAIIFALTICSCAFVVSLMCANKTISLNIELLSSKAIILIVPYIIYILVGVLVMSFFYELNYLTVNMSQNVEVDYLFDSRRDKKINYQV